MATIATRRGNGDKIGDDIIETLLSDNMLIVRGTAELNAHASLFNNITINAIYRAGIKLGDLILLQNVFFEDCIAKITGITINIDEDGAITHTLELEKPYAIPVS
jgi:hypothetical protein